MPISSRMDNLWYGHGVEYYAAMKKEWPAATLNNMDKSYKCNE